MKTMKRLALGTVIASVVISGLLGIVAVLSRTWGELQTKILLTTLTITGTCILLLCAAAFKERRRARLLPAVGMVLALGGALLALGSIWRALRGEAAEKATFIVLIFAVVTALLCLLSMARLKGRFRWALWVSFLSWYALATKLSLMIVADSESEFDLRVVGVSSIVGGCLAILIPIFHRMGSGTQEIGGAAGGTLIHCPLCGAPTPLRSESQRCPDCGRIFLVRVDFEAAGEAEKVGPTGP